MCKLYCILLFFSFQFSFTQDKKVDSIIRIYEDLAWNAIINQKDSGLYYSNKIIEISKLHQNSFKQIIGLEYRGIYNEEVNNNYDEAINDYLLAIQIAETSAKDYVPDLYNQIGILFASVGDHEKASYYYQSVRKKTKNTSINYVNATVNLAYSQSRLGKYNDANQNFLSILEYKGIRIKDKEAAYLGIAKNFTRQSKHQEAQEYYIKGIEADSLKGERAYAQQYADVLYNAFKTKNISSVKKYLEPLHKSYANIVPLRKKLTYYQTAAEAYEMLSDFKTAFYYQDSILATNEILNKKRYNQDLLELETKYQTRKKEEQIIQEKHKKQLWNIIAVFSLIVIFFIIVLLYKNSQKRKQPNQNKAELEKLLNQRNMLLRETHHRVKNSFQMVSSLLQLQAKGSKAQAAITALNSAVERVNSMIVLHQQLYAKDNIIGVNLKEYINDLTNEILSSYTSENITFNVDVTSNITDIETATSIGLLVNELATNSIKYAWNFSHSEKTITLTITLKNNEFLFKMHDNGTSKKSTQIEKNYGFELIEILIERLDAKKHSFHENSFGLSISFKKIS